LKEHGPLGFYRGVTALLMGSIPKAASRFAAFEIFKTFLQDDKGKMDATRTTLGEKKKYKLLQH
jgi:solute carrier family 25 citrate transporter 1